VSGIDWKTGQIIDGWAHTAQSFAILVTTRKNTRVQRRHVGTDIPNLVDKAVSPLTLIDFYAAIVEASQFEPRFRVRRMTTQPSPEGRPVIAIEGDYFPRGHLGDFSVSEPRTMSLAL